MVHAALKLFVITSIVLCAGCASEIVPTQGTRAPTDPSTVKIYQDQPRKYEILFPVEVAVGGDIRWDEKGDATPGFDKLKSQAAAHGANGILLATDVPNTPMVVAGCKGVFYRVPIRPGTPSVAVAKAIYVLKE